MNDKKPIHTANRPANCRLFARTGHGGDRQRGFSLITTLLFMVSALVLGTSVMGVTMMQERMTGNSKDRDLAFQAAEAALRDAEVDIADNLNDASAFTDTCAFGLCTPPSLRASPSPLPADQQSGFSWATAANVRQYGANTGAVALPNVYSPPSYVIEKLGNLGVPIGSSLVPPASSTAGTAYRITARATGGRAETVVVLQAIYAKK